MNVGMQRSCHLVLSTGIKSLSGRKVEGLVNFIQQRKQNPEPEILGAVRLNTKKVVVPAGTSVKVNCVSHCGPIGADMAALFRPNLQLDLLNSGLTIGEGIVQLKRGRTCRVTVPVTNYSAEDVVLESRIPVGVVLPVSTVLPVPMENVPVEKANVGSVAAEAESDVHDERDWIDKLELENLDEEQRTSFKSMLRPHGLFSEGKDDIGAIPKLKMKIQLKDDIPVKANYTSVPRPLFQEVKDYVQVLVNAG